MHSPKIIIIELNDAFYRKRLSEAMIFLIKSLSINQIIEVLFFNTLVTFQELLPHDLLVARLRLQAPDCKHNEHPLPPL